MPALIARISGPASRVRNLLPSPEHREGILGTVFTLFLVIGITLWDEMALQLEPVGWTGVVLAAAVCLAVLSRCRRRIPLLLCAAVLVSLRAAFALLGSVPAGDIRLIADSTIVCISLAAIVFRTEISAAFRAALQRSGEKHAPHTHPHVTASTRMPLAAE